VSHEDLLVSRVSVVTHFDTGGLRLFSSRHADHNVLGKNS
jgi:hypothetical protein